jgi:hypothetical protein
VKPTHKGEEVTDFINLERLDLIWCLERLPAIVKRILRQEKPRSVFVAGGFIRACVANETINDVDIFVGDKNSAERLANQVKEYIKDSWIMSTDNAFTISAKPFAIQFIHRWTFNDVRTCIESFDFTIACAAIYFNGVSYDSLVDPRFYIDLAGKRLVYRAPIREEEPGGSMLRVLKFYQKGYRIPLDSFAAVMARMVREYHENPSEQSEKEVSKVMLGFLYDVDPNVAERMAYLPALYGSNTDKDRVYDYSDYIATTYIKPDTQNTNLISDGRSENA